MFVVSTRAQDVLSVPPTSAPSAAAVQDLNANQPGTIPVPDASLGVPASPSPFQWGPIEARPHLLYRFLYGDGIPVRPGQDATTAIHEVSPGVLLSYGSHWTVDYTPTWYGYSSSQFTDHLDQALHLNFGSTYRDWILNFNHSYLATSTPIVETGQQTDQENHNTTLDAFYNFSSKWSLKSTFTQNLRFTPNFNDLHEWTLFEGLFYAWTPRLQLGAVFSVTYDDVQTGSNMAAENFGGEIRWRMTDRVTLEAHAYAQDRQILDSSVGNLVSPLYGASLDYQPFDFTTLKLSVDRNIAPSFFQDQLTDRVDFKGSIRQRFFGRFFLTVTGDYSPVDYLATVAGTPTVRHDNYYSANFRLSTAVLKRGSISVFYTLSDNSSDIDAFAFNSNQGGVELGFTY